MKKNTKKKFRDIRNAVVMMCVMVAMMSTASYAWFTMTDSPTVTGMKMTATSTSGLKVAKADGSGSIDIGTKADAIDISVQDEDPKILKPVTLGSKVADDLFQEPVYAGTKITKLSPIKDTNLENYVAKYTYYLVSEADAADEAISIGLICGNVVENATGTMGVTAGQANLPGSLVRQTSESKDASEKNPTGAIRVGLVVTDYSTGSEKWIIWEPNNDLYVTDQATDATSFAKVDVSAISITETLDASSSQEGELTTGKGTTSDNTTQELFTIKKGSQNKIDMYIWLEGSDKQCIDEIQASDLEAQIQFTVVKDTVAP